jgi:hypothetical protein
MGNICGTAEVSSEFKKEVKAKLGSLYNPKLKLKTRYLRVPASPEAKTKMSKEE